MSDDIAGEAAYLMNNPAFVQALESAQKQCVNAAMACDIRDDEGRRRFLDAAKNVGRIASHLMALIQATKTGEVVEISDYYETRAKAHWASASVSAQT